MSSAPTAGSLPDRTDIVIVGAGPTGLSLACVLAAHGISFVLLDQAAAGGNTSRAAVVHARTLEVLEEIGASQELLRRGVVVPRFTIRDRDRTLLSVSFAGLPTAYPYTLMVPQNITEEVLHEQLVALGGAMFREHAVTGVEADGHGVTVAVSSRGGAARQVRARYAVGCDGMHSVVRKQAGIGFTGARYAQSFVLADVHMDWPLSREEVALFFSPGGLVVVAPLPEDRYRVVATVDQASEHPGVDDVQALLDARGPAATPAEVRQLVWSSRFSVHHRIADSYRRGPVFLAGDAAHVHSPAGGQGMNIGIQDAVSLAGLLADVLSGRADEAHLDSYQALRRPVALDVVSTTDRITRAATARHPVARTVRNTALSTVGRLGPIKRKLAMNLSELATDPARDQAVRRP
ncbi:MAG: FAD-dependent oxidoreductase [Geodermatophilaceae bacterium]